MTEREITKIEQLLFISLTSALLVVLLNHLLSVPKQVNQTSQCEVSKNLLDTSLNKVAA